MNHPHEVVFRNLGMGRYCKICGRSRPNEQYGGRGLRSVVCARCRRRPKSERQWILATDEVYGFLTQSNISKKNIKRIEQLASIEDATFQDLRTLVLEIATVLPRKRKRWKTLRKRYPDLFRLAVGSNLVDDFLDESEVWPESDDGFEINLDEINIRLLEYPVDDEQR